MKPLLVLLTGCAFASSFTTTLLADEPAAVSVGPAVGALTSAPSSNCAPLILHTDGGYEDAVSWKSGGQVAPYWGAFAERFVGPLLICGLVYDLTQIGYYSGQPADLYIWNDHLGQPGSVRYMHLGVNLGSIATWPEISRHTIAVEGAQYQSDIFWVGIWGEWPHAVNGWFVAVDDTGPIGATPMTNIIGGIGYEPAGWQPVNTVWNDVYALGIGVLARTPNPAGIPEPQVHPGSWGRVKSLYN